MIADLAARRAPQEASPMLEKILSRRPVIQRLRAGPIGRVVDHFVADMLRRGHARRCTAAYVHEGEVFGLWLSQQDRHLEDVTEALISQYLRGPGRRRPETTTPAALGRLLLTLRSTGLSPAAITVASTPVDLLVEAYVAHSIRCRGVTSRTCDGQAHYIREFLCTQFPSGRKIDVGELRPEHVIAHVSRLAAAGHTGTAKKAGSALRMFLRYLVERGDCSPQLVEAVPAVMHRAPRLPRHLTPQQVRQFLRAFDCDTAAGLRDYALALCMLRLGLRVGAAVRLELDDIRWRSGTIHLSGAKSRRSTELPLPRDVGRALARYMREGRPETLGRRVFVTHLTPKGRPLDSGAARRAIGRGFERAALSVPSMGTHVLRHTVATRMIQRGVGMKEIADVLGHRSLATTGIYARVNLPMLRAVAMPWPEVA